MIAVALGLISLVVMIATGVAASSTADDHLTFLGVGVQTTTAQVFLTGAIFGWVFVIALWLLRVGMHRSGERCAKLAARRGRRAGEWLGFTANEADDDGWADWNDWGKRGRRSAREMRGGETDGLRFRTLPPLDRDARRSERARPESPRAAGDGVRSEGIVRRPGSTRHGRGTPWRPDGGADQTNRPGTRAADQLGPLGGGHPSGPVAGRLPGIGVDRGAQRREIGRGSGPVPGEDRGSEGERGPGETR